VVIVADSDGDGVSEGRRPHVGSDDLGLIADELLLARDVLDCQIVDLAGRRVTRASDVVLAAAPGGDLVVAGVELGGQHWFAA
jgi:hypothetical protein